MPVKTAAEGECSHILKEVVKTTLYARDPLLRVEGREETVGLPGEVGG